MLEVWRIDNYDFMKGENSAYFHKSFSSNDEAIKYIKEQLDKQLLLIAKQCETKTELIENYKYGGIDYFIKDSLVFSSWKYVEQSAAKILEERKK